MKRSQVVHQISDNVLTNFFPEMSLQMKNLIADAMVAEAEKMGMQPPNIIKMPDTWFRDTGDYGYESAEWEPE